jgi:hypothetical protein
MKHGIITLLRILLLAAVIGSPFACGSDTEHAALGPIGTPCIPSEEQKRDFPGYETTEVSVERGGETCSPGVCLVAHFQGRVSCPYGQPSNGMADPTTGIAMVQPGLASFDYCYMAGARQDPTTMIARPVQPQLVDRPPEKAVYCSCRCDGPDPKGSYCACPGGYVCEKLLYGGGEPIEGSYCIKIGTQVDDPLALQGGMLCDASGFHFSPRPVGCGLDKHPGGL